MSINAFRAVTLSASILLLAACSSSTKKADSHSGDEENRGQAIAAKLNEGQKVGTPINTICPIGGHGADTDIIVASAKAYLAALNKLLVANQQVQMGEAQAAQTLAA